MNPLDCNLGTNEDNGKSAAAALAETAKINTTSPQLMSNENVALLVEFADDSIISKTLQGTVITWNRAAEKMFGYSKHEMIGKSAKQLFPPDSAECFDENLEKLKRKESIKNRETVRIRKDGSRLDVSVTLSPILADDGSITCIATITRDISEYKLREKQKRETDQLVGLALKAGELGVWDLDLLTGYAWRSLKHDDIFGLEATNHEWNYHTFLNRVIPEDRLLAQSAFDESISSGIFKLECQITKRENQTRWIFIQGETITDADGEPTRMRGTVADITERKLQEEQRRLLSVMKEREDFMSTITHDMKNPLIGADRLLGLFVDGKIGKLDQHQIDTLQCLRNSNLDVLNLINNLTDVYRWEREPNLVELKAVDLKSLLSSSISQFLQLIPSSELEIIENFSESVDIVRADEFAIKRIILNLLDNARKFAKKPAGKITVRLQTIDELTNIEVEDNGSGISTEDIANLFKRFSQGAAGKRYSGGSGLGLYLCKQIMVAHGGSISCHSVEDKFTCFRITFPKSPVDFQ
ncbi:MAG: PAS domain S-box protein [Candidatus Obscuribacterales bacterium]|nr:PAS domain S-box protein [Candidatus Obscuribacterales bacterium]